jgi:hypothetical protein
LIFIKIRHPEEARKGRLNTRLETENLPNYSSAQRDVFAWRAAVVIRDLRVVGAPSPTVKAKKGRKVEPSNSWMRASAAPISGHRTKNSQ